MAKPNSRVKYREYTTIIKGKLYAVVNVPIGDGKYAQKRKRFDSKILAQQWALAELRKHSSSEDVFISSDWTFADLAEWYKEEYLVAPVYQDGKKIEGLRGWKTQRTNLDRLTRSFGKYDIRENLLDVFRRHRRERLKTVTITAINRDFALIRAMFKKAKRRKWIEENPFDFDDEKLIDTALESSRDSKITDRIAKRLLARSRSSEQSLLYYLVLVLMFTGARPSEAYPWHAANDDDVQREPLNWERILKFDFKAVELISYKGKKRRVRLVPTSVELERGLRKFYAETNPQPEDLLFPVTDFKRSWKTLCKRAGVEGVVIRDFRRYFNNYWIHNEDVNDIERLLMLGHKDIKTNLIYSQLDLGFVDKFRSAIKRN